MFITFNGYQLNLNDYYDLTGIYNNFVPSQHTSHTHHIICFFPMSIFINGILLSSMTSAC